MGMALCPKQMAREYELDGRAAWKARAEAAESLLQEIVAASRVGYGGVPVTRSKRVNIPATLFHRAAAILPQTEKGS